MTSPASTRLGTRGRAAEAAPGISPALIRWGGVAGSLLLAVAAYLGGAHTPWRPTITPLTMFTGKNGVVLPVAWCLGMPILVLAWWFGRRVVPSARWAYVTAALWAVPLLPFLPLGSYDIYSYACQGWQQGAGLDPYSAGVDVLGCPWREAVAPTWLASPAPYGPLFLLLGAGAAKAGGSLTGTIAALRVVAVFGVLLIAVSLPSIARRAGVPLKQAVWLALACPLVPIHLISGAHNDAVMVGLVVAGVALAGRRWFWVAGVLFGLAIGIKATAAVVIPFAFLLAGPAPDGAADGSAAGVKAGVKAADRRILRAAAETVGGVVLAVAVFSAVSGRSFGWVTGLAGSGVSVQWTSPSTALGMTIKLFGPDLIQVTRLLGIAALAVALLFFWLRAFQLARGTNLARETNRVEGPRGAEELRVGDWLASYVSNWVLWFGGFALAATVVLAPVFHPWYATWPLALLAATVRRPSRWLLGPVAVASVLCLPDGYNLALATKAQGALLMTALVIYVAWKAVHEAKNRNDRLTGPARGPHGGGGVVG